MLLLVAAGAILLAGQGLPRPVTTADPEQVALGAEIYAENCASCHGVDGVGGNPEAPLQPDENGKYPAPPHDAAGHTWHHPDWQLVQIVREGSSYDDFVSEMPGFADTLNDDEIEAVFVYIKTLWDGDQLEHQATVSAQPTQ